MVVPQNNQLEQTPTERYIKASIASSQSAALEVFMFHWADTVAKRASTHQGALNLGNFSQVVLRDAAGKGFYSFQWMRSLYAGLPMALPYKVLERNLKFALQTTFLPTANQQFQNPVIAHAVAGSAAAVIEAMVCNIPDAMKIKRQTNAAYYAGRPIMDVIKEEKLWSKGLLPTIARNIPGSATLFASVELIRQHAFGLQYGQQATMAQTFVAATFGSCMSIIVPAPLNLVKIRVQSSPQPEGALLPTLFTIAKSEGVRALYKSVRMQCGFTALKQAFFMTAYDRLRNDKKVTAPAVASTAPVAPKKESRDVVGGHLRLRGLAHYRRSVAARKARLEAARVQDQDQNQNQNQNQQDQDTSKKLSR